MKYDKLNVQGRVQRLLNHFGGSYPFAMDYARRKGDKEVELELVQRALKAIS